MQSNPQNGPIERGVYEHFTGNRYHVDGFGYLVLGDGQEETVGEQVVVYHAMFTSEAYGKEAVWVRPLKNFTEEIMVDGRPAKRFRYLGDEGAGPSE
ncbi:DUF1653 domain-containing protein [Streptomyces sp. NPDC052236]|uniref:DUF1653 domain-containing protein n=1 Tax=Streptomyces sp. NPDC052236 TaxID=3365686 RepID=UPI0037D11372